MCIMANFFRYSESQNLNHRASATALWFILRSEDAARAGRIRDNAVLLRAMGHKIFSGQRLGSALEKSPAIFGSLSSAPSARSSKRFLSEVSLGVKEKDRRLWAPAKSD